MNEATINVATELWLPSLPNFKLQGPIDSRLYGLMVGDLMNGGVGY